MKISYVFYLQLIQSGLVGLFIELQQYGSAAILFCLLMMSLGYLIFYVGE